MHTFFLRVKEGLVNGTLVERAANRLKLCNFVQNVAHFHIFILLVVQVQRSQFDEAPPAGPVKGPANCAGSVVVLHHG